MDEESKREERQRGAREGARCRATARLMMRGYVVRFYIGVGVPGLDDRDGARPGRAVSLCSKGQIA